MSLSAPLLVLDLDGTLVDSVGGLAVCANRLLRRRKLKRIDETELRPMIGDGIPALLERILVSRGARLDDRALSAFLVDYSAHAADASGLFAGIEAMLDRAAADGFRFAVCTNKTRMAAQRLLDELGIGDRFATIGGGDSFSSRKPDPSHLLQTIAAANGQPGRAVMVGDHRNDVGAARGARVPAIFAGWGYGDADMAEGAAAVANVPGEVPYLALRLLG